jgi:hypothetical protein
MPADSKTANYNNITFSQPGRRREGNFENIVYLSPS